MERARPFSNGGIGISEDHIALRQTVKRWTASHCPPAVPRELLDAADEEIPPFWDDLSERGWLGLHVPEARGGEGFGLGELAVVLEELGRVCAPGPFVSTTLAAAVVDRFGGETLAASVLPDLIAGRRIGAVAFGCAPQPAAPASDGAAGAAGSVLLDGAWEPVLSGTQADVLVLPVAADAAGSTATADPEASSESGTGTETWVVVTADQLEVEPLASLDRTRRVARVKAERVVVSADHVLRSPAGSTGVEGLAALLLSAESAGVAAWCVECAAEYATVREQFGRPIGQFQAVKHRCADMLADLEQARAAAWDACRGGQRAGDELAVAVAAAVAPEAAYDCAKDCIQVLGGIGFTWVRASLVGSDSAEPVALAAGVVLVDDGTEPVERGPLDLDRAGGGGVHDDPSHSSGNGPSARVLTTCSYGSNPSSSPSTAKRTVTASSVSPSAPTTSASRADVTSAVAPQSATMYPASAGLRCQLIG